MNRIISVIIIIIGLFISQANAGISDKLIFNFGGSFSPVKTARGWSENRPFDAESYYSDRKAAKHHTNIYGLYIESLFPTHNKLVIGGGIYYLFNGNDGKNSYAPYFQEQYPVNHPYTEGTPEQPTHIHFLMPYIAVEYQFNLLKGFLYSKFGIGPGYGILNAYTSSDIKLKRSSAGIGTIASLGINYAIIRNMGLNFEMGYRFIKIGKMERDYYYNENLDLSGLFIQSGFTFCGWK